MDHSVDGACRTIVSAFKAACLGASKKGLTMARSTVVVPVSSDGPILEAMLHVSSVLSFERREV